MNEFNTDRLKEYLIRSGDHLKPSSLGPRIRCVKSLFRWSHEEGYTLKNPAAKLKEPKLGKRIPKFLSELEIEHLREACQTTMEKALFEFMYSTGCRIGEIVKLNREDIDFQSNSVIVQGKGNKEREVYFNTRELWISGVNNRSGAVQYAMLSPALRKQSKSKFEQTHWITGQSSPSVSNFRLTKVEKLSESKMQYTVKYDLWASYGDFGGGEKIILVEKNLEPFKEYWFISSITTKYNPWEAFTPAETVLK